MISTPHSELAIDAAKKLQAEQLREDPRVKFYDQAYKQQNTVWDIGQPQPEMARILSERENDTKSTAIEESTNKAKARGLADRVTFKVLDCRELSKLGQGFDIIIDSGFSHILPAEQRQFNADILRTVVAPGGRVYILSCANKVAINSSAIRERKMPPEFFIHGADQPTKQQSIQTIPITSEEEFIMPPGMTKQDIHQLYSKETESVFHAATGQAAPALLSVITYVGEQTPSASTTSSK